MSAGRAADRSVTTNADSAGYRSPLMSRLAAGKLTLELLARDVPLYQAGQRAGRLLANLDGGVGEGDRRRIVEAHWRGEAAKERLILAGLPLIRLLAGREYQRRRGWQSQIAFDDLVQEGVSGLLRGLMAYNPHSGQRSATNYLGQWILVEMRRNSERLDNDLGVPFDASERFRRIRALRSRLISELGREPTDEEIAAASGDPLYGGGGKMGRVHKTNSGPRQLTVRQVAEERELRSRVGHAAPLDPDLAAGPQGPRLRPIYDDGGDDGDAATAIVNQAARDALADVLRRTLDEMNLPPGQREIITRRYGLPPHPFHEQSIRDISRTMNLPRERVSRVLEAFTAEMARPGGVFHRVCARIPAEDLADLGLGWVPATLGVYADVPTVERSTPLPDVLAVPFTGHPDHPPGPAAARLPAGPDRGGRVHARFQCAAHGGRFVGVYLTRTAVPAQRVCPVCQQPAHLVDVTRP